MCQQKLVASWIFLERSRGGGQKGTVSPPFEPAVVCLAFVYLDGHSELKSKLELAANVTNKQHYLTKQANKLSDDHN